MPQKSIKKTPQLNLKSTTIPDPFDPTTPPRQRHATKTASPQLTLTKLVFLKFSQKINPIFQSRQRPPPRKGELFNIVNQLLDQRLAEFKRDPMANDAVDDIPDEFTPNARRRRSVFGQPGQSVFVLPGITAEASQNLSDRLVQWQRRSSMQAPEHYKVKPVDGGNIDWAKNGQPSRESGQGFKGQAERESARGKLDQKIRKDSGEELEDSRKSSGKLRRSDEDSGESTSQRKDSQLSQRPRNGQTGEKKPKGDQNETEF